MMFFFNILVPRSETPIIKLVIYVERVVHLAFLVTFAYLLPIIKGNCNSKAVDTEFYQLELDARQRDASHPAGFVQGKVGHFGLEE